MGYVAAFYVLSEIHTVLRASVDIILFCLSPAIPSNYIIVVAHDSEDISHLTTGVLNSILTTADLQPSASATPLTQPSLPTSDNQSSSSAGGAQSTSTATDNQSLSGAKGAQSTSTATDNQSLSGAGATSTTTDSQSSSGSGGAQSTSTATDSQSSSGAGGAQSTSTATDNQSSSGAEGAQPTSTATDNQSSSSAGATSTATDNQSSSGAGATSTATDNQSSFGAGEAQSISTASDNQFSSGAREAQSTSTGTDYQSSSGAGGAQSTSTATYNQPSSGAEGAQSTSTATDDQSSSGAGGAQSISTATDQHSMSTANISQSTLSSSVIEGDGAGAVMSTECAKVDDGINDTSSAVTLTIDDTQEVYEMMYSAREKWRSIGGIFSIPESTLDNIDAENRNNEDKLRKVIIEWLKGNGRNKTLTWSQVVMALRNKTVAREDLAQEVLQLHPQPGLECATVQSGSASSLPDNAHITAVAHKPTTFYSPQGKLRYW